MPQLTDAEQRERAAFIAEAALEKKAERLVALDVREVTSYADTFILVSGNSDRHARAIADSVCEAVATRGERPLGVEGYDEGRWVLIDLGDVIVHVFQPEVREKYDLERLWSDAPAIPIDSAAAATG